MGGVARSDPELLAAVGARVVAEADRIHAAVAGVAPGVVDDGFATTVAAAALWAALRPGVLAGGARLASFGDDLTAAGRAWVSADAAGAQGFLPSVGGAGH